MEEYKQVQSEVDESQQQTPQVIFAVNHETKRNVKSKGDESSSKRPRRREGGEPEKESDQGAQGRKRQKKEELKDLSAGLNLKIKIVRKVEAPPAT